MKTEIDLIEPKKNGLIEVRKVTTYDDGEQEYKRWTLIPGQNIDDQEQSVKDVCQTTWTPEIIAAYPKG